MPRRRLRTFTLWTGTLLCVLIAAAFVWSAWWLVTSRAGEVHVGIASGCVGVTLGGDRIFVGVHWQPFGLSDWNTWDYVPPPGDTSVWFPLYAVFLAVAIPTLLIWRFVPKFPRGHCRRCGYNLTGLTEARCPECGMGFQKGGEACG